MADQLKVYNKALTHLGERTIADLTDDVEPRYLLDNAWADGDALKYILRITKPAFARKVALLNTPVASIHGLEYEHDAPEDFLDVVALFSDAELDQPINRFLFEGGKFYSDYDEIYLRYVRDDVAVTDFDEVNIEALAFYLAWQISPFVANDQEERLEARLTSQLELIATQESMREPMRRPQDKSGTLTPDWRNIYNDALQILGLTKLSAADDDSDRRQQLDTARDSNLVETVLEDTAWVFALLTVKSDADTGVEPAYGYLHAHPLPDDLQRLDGVFLDEYFNYPQRDYKMEEQVIYTNVDILYIQYVSKDYLTNVAAWPPSFRRLIAARLAKDACMVLRPDNAQAEARAEREYKSRLSNAKNNDAIQQPPKPLPRGSWIRGRRGYYSSGDRFGR